MSVSKKKNIDFEFRITTIDLIEKYFQRSPNQGSELPEVQFNLVMNVSIDKESRKITIILSVRMNLINNDSIVANISVGCTFEIINFEEIIIQKEGTLTIPDAILETLNILTIGTTRGIMFSEFRGTWLHNTILPVIDPKSFIVDKK